MLIKRTELMASNVKSVKKSGIKLAAIALVAATAYAPTTMASEPLLNGTSAVYAELMKKSKRVCRSDRNTLKYTGETVEECVADLMDQFIESADIESLKKRGWGERQVVALVWECAREFLVIERLVLRDEHR